eukprot:SAG31_NODE_885_length_11254_cov_14.613088_3_plen_144_part_00
MGWHHQKLLLLDSQHTKHRNTNRVTDVKRKSSRCRFDELTLKTMPVHTCDEGLVACRLDQVLKVPHVPASPKDRRGLNRFDQSVEDFPTMTTAHAAATAHTKGTVMKSNWKPIQYEGQHAAYVPAGDGFIRKISGRHAPAGRV